jgi:hypothetical protein
MHRRQVTDERAWELQKATQQLNGDSIAGKVGGVVGIVVGCGIAISTAPATLSVMAA